MHKINYKNLVNIKKNHFFNLSLKVKYAHLKYFYT